MKIDKLAGTAQSITDKNIHPLSQTVKNFTYLWVQNRLHDNSGNAVNGNPVLLGTREQLLFEIASGDTVELRNISPSVLFVQQLTSSTPTGIVYVAWMGFEVET